MMAGMGSFNIRGLTELQREMEKLQDPNAFVEACVKELAARLLRLVIKRTPVGDYSGQSYTCETGFSHKGKKVILSILVYTFFTRMFDFMLPLVVKYSIVAA